MRKPSTGDGEDNDETKTIRATVKSDTYKTLNEEKTKKGRTWKGLLRDFAEYLEDNEL
jgi:hypothetical protein